MPVSSSRRGDYESPHRRYLYNWLSNNRVLTASIGTPYACTQHELNSSAYDVNDFPYPRRYSEQAATELEGFLDPHTPIDSTVRAAIVRLQAALEILDWEPDIVIKAFYDLDIVFFNGKLRGHATIQWHTASWWTDYYSGDGLSDSYGLTQYMGQQRAGIHLNAYQILLNSTDAKVYMWKTALHEMVHAYVFVMSGIVQPSSYDMSRGWYDSHGLVFRRLIHAVHARAMYHLKIEAIGRTRYEY